MEDAHAGSPPEHILGYPIRSRTRIYVSYIIPATLGLLIFIVQTIADCAVSYQHFKDRQPDFGAGTISLVFIPPFLTFVSIVISRNHRADPQNSNYYLFLGKLLLQLIFFPVFVIYRFLVRTFWSVEALFHDDNDTERMWCLSKAEECSSCELYLLIQAYAQAAPQIILQLYHMLTLDLFRDFDTTSVQAICLVFSALDLAGITTAYHRFESQKKVGRHYPWSTPQQIEAQRSVIKKNNELQIEVARKRHDSERFIASFPESEKIMTNFRKCNASSLSHESDEPRTHELSVKSEDEVDNDALETVETKVLLHNPSQIHITKNATDDDKIKVRPKPKRNEIMNKELLNADHIEFIDSVPDTTAPEPPTSSANSTLAHGITMEQSNHPPLIRSSSRNSDTNRSKRYSRPLSQLETFKDMLIVNAQLYIKEHVPRPPKLLITRVNEEEHDDEKTPLVSTPPPPLDTYKSSPLVPDDVVDFFLPRPTKVVNGIKQDDFAGKTVAFFGWIAFIIMRMLTLATFCVFYPKAFFIVISIHYALMLAALFLETRSSLGNLNRTLFYLLLAYIYIFVLLEFRIKFKHIRVWYLLYLLLTMLENITMTSIWYMNEDFESWWFGFIWEWIVYSGILFIATIVVYYFILKPEDVTLIVEDEHTNSNTNNEANI